MCEIFGYLFEDLPVPCAELSGVNKGSDQTLVLFSESPFQDSQLPAGPANHVREVGPQWRQGQFKFVVAVFNNLIQLSRVNPDGGAQLSPQ